MMSISDISKKISKISTYVNNFSRIIYISILYISIIVINIIFINKMSNLCDITFSHYHKTRNE